MSYVGIEQAGGSTMADERTRVNQDTLSSTRGVQKETGDGTDSFDQQLQDQSPERIRDEVVTNVTTGDQDKELDERFPDLSKEDLSQLAILEPGTQLPQGSVFLDLNDLEAGPFKAIGGQEAGGDQRLIAKSDTDYEMWNRLAGQDAEPELERPQ
jgi:hypothetical protein